MRYMKPKFERTRARMISAIYDRRSIRKFMVIQGNAKKEMLKVFRQGIEREENHSFCF